MQTCKNYNQKIYASKNEKVGRPLSVAAAVSVCGILKQQSMNITASWWEISSPLASLLHGAANVGAAQLQWTAGQQQSPMLPSAHPNQPQPMLPCKHRMDPCMCLPVLYSWWIFPAEIQKDALRYCPRGANQKLNPCSEGDICDTCSEYRMIVTTHIKPNFSVSAPSKQNYPLLPHPCSKCSGFRGHTSCTGMEQ